MGTFAVVGQVLGAEEQMTATARKEVEDKEAVALAPARS